ncbi:hypothetical protein [Stomatobaculum longum]|uniref:hypothetical protein n=1 Tax=Stomatobaculum longum TaxID=796942 RepID=UPI0028F0F4D5|nr:hypothetical protein [Stomatobaculum longum]
MNRIKSMSNRLKRPFEVVGLYFVACILIFLIVVIQKMELLDAIFVTGLAGIGIDRWMSYKILEGKILEKNKHPNQFEEEYYDLYWSYNQDFLDSWICLMFTFLSVLSKTKLIELLSKQLYDVWLKDSFKDVDKYQDILMKISYYAAGSILVLIAILLSVIIVALLFSRMKTYELINVKNNNYGKYTDKEKEILGLQTQDNIEKINAKDAKNCD